MKEWLALRVRTIRLGSILGSAIVVVGAAIALALVVGLRLVPPVASQPAAPSAPGTFKPTEAQLKGLKISPVALLTFHSESITEGNIAIDDDLTTPVFSPYSG